ncbi:MAG TPA: response regulator [Chthoniobacteraceae bacterium]|nr:response regulator [Chthoniobacteraceae bacterium]
MRKIDLKSLLGTAIRNKRNELGFSQEELADRAGLHRTYISDIERGARNLSLESIDKLAQALKISIGALFISAGDFAEPDKVLDGIIAPGDMVDILLVEDNESDIELTLEAFKKAKLSNRVQVARDGLEALDFLFRRNRHAERKPDEIPHVVLLDLNLPKISGIEVLRQIKSNDRLKNLHVIVLTASQQDQDIVLCRKLGAETYIVKPVNFNNLGEVTARLNLHWALLKENTTLAA